MGVFIEMSRLELRSVFIEELERCPYFMGALISGCPYFRGVLISWVPLFQGSLYFCSNVFFN